MGIHAHSSGEDLYIQGGQPVAAEIETYNDHRIAMSFCGGRAARSGDAYPQSHMRGEVLSDILGGLRVPLSINETGGHHERREDRDEKRLHRAGEGDLHTRRFFVVKFLWI